MFDSKIVPILLSSPDDVSGLERMIDSGEINPHDIKGLNISHEGDSYARAFSQVAYATMLAKKLDSTVEEVLRTMPMQGIAGVAGFMTPHIAVFVRSEVEGKEGKEKRMVVAGANTREFLPEEAGTMAQLEGVAETVRALMKEAQISDPKDVHFVFVKGPWPTWDQRADAQKRGKKTVSDDENVIGQYSRSASALGVALALGEVKAEDLSQEAFMTTRETLYSNIAHCSSGGERKSCSITLVGNTTKSVSKSIVGHGLLEDGLDTDGVKRILKDMGFKFNCCPTKKDQARIEYAFLKPKTAEVSEIRGYRHTMNTDTWLAPYWWLVEKAGPHALVGSVLGTTLFEVATGFEHQGPPGKPGLAVIAKAG